MGIISTILIPFDFSKAAKRALEYAIYFTARNPDIQIILAYSSGHGNFKLLPENFIRLEEKYRTLLKNKLKWTIDDGTLSQTISKIQQSRAVDFIVMGTFGTNKDYKTEQSNTTKIMLETDCPVLAVPWEYKNFNLNHIALVLGKEEIKDKKSLEIILQIARSFNAKVHVITADKSLGTYGCSKQEEKNEQAIQYYLENFYTERIFVKNENVLDGVLTYAWNHDIDLLTLLPNHSISRKGKLTQSLTLQSKVPVLVLN